MTAGVHSTAVVDPGVELGSGVEIGPYCVLGPGVRIGAGTSVGPHAVIQRDTLLGAGCVVGPGAVLGADPQDLKYRGEATCLEVGDHTRIREYATLHRGTAASGRTVVGKRCYLMAYVHVAHDCVIEDDVVIANAVQLAGHVHVEANANIGGLTPIHQFVRIGAYAFVGALSGVEQDIPPYVKAVGNRAKPFGLNVVGLRRHGFSAEEIRVLKQAYRIVFTSDLNTSQALEKLEQELSGSAAVQHFIDFIKRSQRGISK